MAHDAGVGGAGHDVGHALCRGEYYVVNRVQHTIAGFRVRFDDFGISVDVVVTAGLLFAGQSTVVECGKAKCRTVSREIGQLIGGIVAVVDDAVVGNHLLLLVAQFVDAVELELVMQEGFERLVGRCEHGVVAARRQYADKLRGIVGGAQLDVGQNFDKVRILCGVALEKFYNLLFLGDGISTFVDVLFATVKRDRREKCGHCNSCAA